MQGVFESGKRLEGCHFECIDKKSFSERNGAILKASTRRVFQSERVPFEGIGKEFFLERRRLP